MCFPNAAWIHGVCMGPGGVSPLTGSTNETLNPPGMRRRSDVSFWSHLSWDVADNIETSSRRRHWYVNETDLFGTLSQRLTST